MAGEWEVVSETPLTSSPSGAEWQPVGQHPVAGPSGSLLTDIGRRAATAGTEALGGFLGVKDVLAEDYVIGAKYQESGRRVQLSPLLVPTVMGKRSIRSFFSRRLRWCQLRRRSSSSAIWMAFSAAPLRRLSLETNSARPCSTPGSRRMRPT